MKIAVSSPSDPDDSGPRRQDPRVERVLALRYRSAGHLLVSYCTNLSRGGLFVATEHPPPRGTRMTLELALPGLGELARVDASVRWSRDVPGPEGPAGMGVRFDSIDSVLGARIDHMVAEFTPLRIDIVGDPRHPWEHIAALVRSLVHSDTRHHAVGESISEQLHGADLVIVDLDGDGELGLTVLERLTHADVPVPAIALVPARSVDLRQRAGRLARVVATPVDSGQLQATVLAALAEVRAGL